LADLSQLLVLADLMAIRIVERRRRLLAHQHQQARNATRRTNKIPDDPRY
jgi:hypothetical protein